MALHIASEHVDRLARELVAVTGEKLTTAVGKALEERLARVRPNGPSPSEEERWRQIEAMCAESRAQAVALGIEPLTKQELEEMLGFDEY
jgi:hypothetical protein